MSVNLSGTVPANPGASSGSIFDNILGGAGDLGDALWQGLDGLLGFVGDVFQGAIDVGGAIIGGALNLIQGAVSFFGNLLGTVTSWFTKEPPREPLPDIFSPIAADLEGDLEPFLTKVDNLVQASSEMGDQLDDLNGELTELIDPTSESGPLWQIQAQINELSEDRDDLQDDALEANRMGLEALQRYIARGMFLPDSSKVNTIANPHWHVSFTVNGQRRLFALGDWVGEFSYQCATHRSGDFGPVIEGGSVTPANREFLLDTATSSASLQYWIRPGTAKNFVATRGSLTPDRDTWLPIPEYQHVATVAGKHYVQFRVTWAATTRTDSYGVMALLNGVEYKVLRQVGIGPWLPGQDGRRNQSLQFEIDLAKDDVLTFAILAGSTTASERRSSSSSIAIQWLENAVASDIVTT